MLMDTYAVTRGHLVSGVVKGKPLDLGGSAGRRDATDEGVFIVTRDILGRLGKQIQDQRVIIQGFGNVGAVVESFFHTAGARVIAIQDLDGAIHSAQRVDPKALVSYKDDIGSIRNFPKSETITREAFWAVPAGLLIPAALENQNTEEQARVINVWMVIEGANGPILPEGEAVLGERGIIIIPDALANTGGMITSYFEWVQDTSSFFWPEREVRKKLKHVLLCATQAVWECHLEYRISLREAACILVCRRVLEAREKRGLYP